MQELTKALNTADDDYLIGLSNKGILKRAYKDLEESEISADYNGDTAEVSIAGENVTVSVPLGNSKCSCPSRSVCRHIIASILWLKRQNSSSDIGSEKSTASQESEDVQEKKELSAEFIAEISSFPLKALQKAMKKQYYNSFVFNAEKGILPEIEETSILAVKIPNENINVRLVFPLEYSTCTCHSKELCRHKAAAILTWQIKHKIVTAESIKINEEAVFHLDIKKIHDTIKTVKSFLVDILSGGLVRVPDDITERAEAMAVLCHNSRLANSERLMRETGNRLQGYIKHTPEFRSDILFSLILDNILLADKILSTEDEKKLYPLLGEFKSTYTATDTLELLPIAKRKFSSMSGYEGDIYYFLNKDTQSPNKFLSYSNVRPTFYETGRKTSSQYNAPWGLYGSMNDMMNSEIRLKNPKLSDGKISSSSDTHAEAIGKLEDLNHPAVYESIYTDFEKMLKDIFQKQSNAETDRLVLLSPMRCVRSESDEITQSHIIIIEDEFGHFLTIKARYKSDNKEFFSLLSHIGYMMMENTDKTYVIFANTYIENGMCYLYPIAIFDTIKVPKIKSDITYERDTRDTKNYLYFSELFYDIQKSLGDIIQCGINSFDLYEQIEDYALESQKFGLLMLSDKLKKLYELFKAKNHTVKNDNMEIIRMFSEIHNYLLIGIQKTEVQQAINNLYDEENEDELITE